MKPIYFGYLSFFSTLALFAACVWQRKRLKGNLKLLFPLVAVDVASDVLSYTLSQLRINSWPLGNAWYLFQFAFLFLMLTGSKVHLLIRSAFWGALAFGLLDFVFIEKPTTFNSYTAYISGILMITLSIFYLYRLMIDMPVERVQSLPGFWLAFGALIFYSGTLFLFLFNNYLIVNQPANHQIIWNLHNLLNLAKNAFLFLALWTNYKGKTSSI